MTFLLFLLFLLVLLFLEVVVSGCPTVDLKLFLRTGVGVGRSCESMRMIYLYIRFIYVFIYWVLFYW